MKQFIRWFRFI